MSFLSSLVVDAETIVAPVLASLTQSTTVQNIEKYLLQFIVAVEFKQTNFVLGQYTITAALNGTPAALTLDALFLGAAKVESGQVGTFQCGDVVVNVELTSAAQAAPAA